MLFNHVVIESTGYDLPPLAVTSEMLEERLSPVYERLGLSKGRLELMTGIRERRFYPDGTKPSDASTRAGRAALEKAGLSGKEIGFLIHASVSRDFLEPATASVVHHNLNLPADCPFIDVSNACLGFANSMLLAANMLELNQIKRALIVAGENGKPLVDATLQYLLEQTPVLDHRTAKELLKKAFASLTIGSGAVAMVLARQDATDSRHRLLGGTAMSATEHSALCMSSTDMGVHSDSRPLMETDSEALLHAGCALAEKNWIKFKKLLGWTESTPDRIFTHQVGSAHRRLLYDTLKLDIEKDFPTLEYLGNIGSVSLPLTFARGVEEGIVKEGQNIALLGIGSGLSSIMLGVRW